MDIITLLNMFIQACSAFAGAAWAAKRYVTPVRKQIDDHEKKDFEFHAKVQARLWPASN